MKPDLLVTAELPAPIVSTLKEKFVVHDAWHAKDIVPFVSEIAHRIKAVFTLNSVGADAEFMDQLPGLEIICCLGVGYDRIDLDAARERGIAVTNSPGSNSSCVADLAMTLLLDAVRRVSLMDRKMRELGWLADRLTNVAPGFNHKKIGIVGMGNIGQAIAQRAAGFDLDIHYHSRTPKPDLPYHYHNDVLSMAREADYLVLACPGGRETHHLVSRPVLEALGPGGTLVNIARGSVVDQATMIKMLSSGQLGAAGLDVFDGEPIIPEALMQLDNVVITPHIGGVTLNAIGDAVDMVMANLDAYFEGRPLLTQVT